MLLWIKANLIKFNANTGTCQNPVKELRWKTLQKVNGFLPLTIFAKHSILDFLKGSKYVSTYH